MKKVLLVWLYIFLVFPFSPSCGGGGSNNTTISPGVPYTGVNEAGVITAQNAVILGTGSFNGFKNAGIAADSLPGSVAMSAGPAAMVLFSPGSFPREALENPVTEYVIKQTSIRAVPLAAGDDTISGYCEGFAMVTGSVNVNSGAFDIVINYEGYSDDCFNYLDGDIEIVGVMDPYTFEIQPSMTVIFGTLNVNSEEGSFTLGGTWDLDYSSSPGRISMDLVVRDESTMKTVWTRDYVILSTQGQDDQGNYEELTISGRYYDPDHGYVDVATLNPIQFYRDQINSSAGTLVLTGGLDTSAILECLSQVYFTCSGDTTGDGAYDFDSGVLAWPWQSNYYIYESGLAQANSDVQSPGKAAIGFDGENYLVITRRVYENSSETVGVFLSNIGAVVGTLSLSQTAASFGKYSIAFDDTNYLLVYSHLGDIIGQRITPDGQALDGPSGFLIAGSDSNSRPSVAFDGTNYLVVWPKYINGGYDIYGARVSPGGEVLGIFPVFEAEGEQVQVSLAFGGTSYLALWRDTRSGSGPASDTDIYGTRIGTDGTVLDAGGIPVCAGSSIQEYPELAFDGTNFFAVWSDYRNVPDFHFLPYQAEVFGSRISTEGKVLDPGGIPIKTGDYEGQGNPSIDFDGTHYVLTWQTGSYPTYPPSGIFAERLTTAGELLGSTTDSVGIPISGTPPDHAKYIYPVVKSNGTNSLLIWTNNFEVSGSSKDIRGTIFPNLNQFP